MATEKRASDKKPTKTAPKQAPRDAPEEPHTDWSVEKLIGLGVVTLGSFLVLIYFVSP
jgi:hypothetical protein